MGGLRRLFSLKVKHEMRLNSKGKLLPHVFLSDYPSFPPPPPPRIIATPTGIYSEASEFALVFKENPLAALHLFICALDLQSGPFTGGSSASVCLHAHELL